MYAKKRWIPFFKTLDRITEAGGVDYYRARLRKVRRTTVVKELSALRRFLRWCKLRGYLAEVPTIPSPPRTATGVDYDKGRRNKIRVDLTEEEAQAILGCLPERMRGGANPRAFFTLMYETTLRRGTLICLMAPTDYVKGRSTLQIRREADKARFARELPLSVRAREALDSVCPDAGLIFGDVKYRSPLKTAALAAGLSEERAHHLSYHDWRHASLTHMASRTTDLVGLAYLAGHKDVTTTAKYVHAHRRAAEQVIQAVAVHRAANGSAAPRDPDEDPDSEPSKTAPRGTMSRHQCGTSPKTTKPSRSWVHRK